MNITRNLPLLPVFLGASITLLFASSVLGQEASSDTETTTSVTESAESESKADANQKSHPPLKLFNGNDLSGWDGDPRLWSVQDGVIHGETTPELKTNQNTFLILKDIDVADFELTLEYRCSETNNSGIQYRSRRVVGEKVRNNWVLHGYQHELRNEVDMPNVTGFIYGEGLGRGRICLTGEKAVMENGEKKLLDNLITAEEFKTIFKVDEWNSVRIVAKGAHLQHYLNGKLILDFVDAPDLVIKHGVFGLQLHSGEPMWAEFRNIELTEFDTIK